MSEEENKKQALLQELREEIKKLLCSDNVSEDEKVTRMRKAQDIIELGVPNGE